MMKPEISVIVPVYNVEPYLKRCLDSIINQSMKEIEILVIDDGSTDASGKICDDYARLDNRIRVIHQENGGLSHARNAGLDIAQGKYIMFVDSDDYVEKDFCKIPYDISKGSNHDMVVFKSKTHFVDKEIVMEINIPEGPVTKEKAIEFLDKDIKIGCWNKLYSSYLFKNIRFPEGKNYEDVVVSFELITASSSIYFSRSVLYNYVKRPNSITDIKSTKNKFDYLGEHHKLLMAHIINGYPYKITGREFFESVCYLTYFGFDSKLSNESIDFIKTYEYDGCVNLETRILGFLSLNSKWLFNFLCIVFNRRGNVKRYLSK